MRITTKKGRDFAFKLRAIRNARTGQKKWFVGITTKEYFWLDLSNEWLETATYLAHILKNRLNTTVYIFKTTKSYWLVTKKKLFGIKWDKEYKHWLKVPKGLVCHAFCECCIRYHKATLRVSAKKGKRPVLVKVIKCLDGNGKLTPVTAREQIPSSGVRARGTHYRVTPKLNINTLVSWLLNKVLFIGEQGIKNALNPYGEAKSHYRKHHSARVRDCLQKELSALALKCRVLTRKVLLGGRPFVAPLGNHTSDLLKI